MSQPNLSMFASLCTTLPITGPALIVDGVTVEIAGHRIRLAGDTVGAVLRQQNPRPAMMPNCARCPRYALIHNRSSTYQKVANLVHRQYRSLLGDLGGYKAYRRPGHSTGFHPNKIGRLSAKKPQDIGEAQLLAQQHLACRINSVKVEEFLRKVQPDRGKLLDERFLEMRVRSQ